MHYVLICQFQFEVFLFFQISFIRLKTLDKLGAIVHVAKFKKPYSSVLIQFISMYYIFSHTYLLPFFCTTANHGRQISRQVMTQVPWKLSPLQHAKSSAQKHYIAFHSSLFIIYKQIKYLHFSYYFQMAQVLNREEETE